jgi:hypothetical protein
MIISLCIICIFSIFLLNNTASILDVNNTTDYFEISKDILYDNTTLNIPSSINNINTDTIKTDTVHNDISNTIQQQYNNNILPTVTNITNTSINTVQDNIIHTVQQQYLDNVHNVSFNYYNLQNVQKLQMKNPIHIPCIPLSLPNKPIYENQLLNMVKFK